LDGSVTQSIYNTETSQHIYPANSERMPIWIRQKLGSGDCFGKTQKAIQSNRLNTVCEEARCPNRGECWSAGTATIMLLGETCTRACGFCSVKTGKPDAVDKDEPKRVSRAVKAMGLDYVVLTSVNRDDLADGGAGIFAETLKHIRRNNAETGIEFLTPDFHRCQQAAIHRITSALNETPGTGIRLVWGHNIETVPRLYRRARKAANYWRSLELLQTVAALPDIEAKSAIMLGLGETFDEVVAVLTDLRQAGVQRIALGQYLRPGSAQLPVASYIHPKVFDKYENIAWNLGFGWVKSGPLVRSSYRAEQETRQPTHEQRKIGSEHG
jgi:lipoyl synthase